MLTLSKTVATAAIVLAGFGAACHAAGSPEDSSAEIAEKLVSKSLPGGPGTIAVGTITHSDGACSEMTRFLEEELVDALFNANTGEYNIIERSQLSAIFRELELVYDGTIAPDTAVQIGDVKGVRGVVSGKITEYSDRILFRVRLINTADGTITSSSKSEFPITQPVRDLMQNRSRVLCGFDRQANVNEGNGPAPVQVIAVQPSQVATDIAPVGQYEGQGYTIGVRNLSFSKAKQEIAVALRIKNTSDKPISFSYITGSLSVTDDKGNNYLWKDLWSGLRSCGRGYAYTNCIDPKTERVTGIAAGKSAQLSFNVNAEGVDEPGLVSIGFEVVHNSDTSTNNDWQTASVGLFDLPVKK